MIFQRQYLQFNNLVFEGVALEDTNISFKTYETSYGFGHGSYAPLKSDAMWLQAGRASLTLTFKLKKISCEDRSYFVRFAKSELAKPGRLWAIQDNTIIWAYAYVSSIVEVHDVRKNVFTADVDFTLPEGIWHKANKLKTFLVLYDPFDFTDNYQEEDLIDCIGCQSKPKRCNCCDESLTADMALAYYGDIHGMYECEPEDKYKLVYSCAAGDKYFGDYCGVIHYGQRICSDCNGVVAGQYYSDTDIPTDGVKITIVGKMQDPVITINDNSNIILGEYDGTLTINSDGSVYYENDCCESLVEVGAWVIPEGMEYGWLIHQGNNKVVVDTNACCSACVYIEADSLAI